MKTFNVRVEDRMEFLPDLGKEMFMQFESGMYRLANEYIVGYQGGFWEFVKVDNGAKFMYPEIGTVRLVNHMNYFDERVSQETAGLAVTLLVLNQFVWITHRSENIKLARHFQREYDLLIDYARTLPDDQFSKIAGFLD